MLKSVKWLERKCLRLKSAIEMKLTPAEGRNAEYLLSVFTRPSLTAGVFIRN
jgi:hypothetical protein